jgi:hypothetical protein
MFGGANPFNPFAAFGAQAQGQGQNAQGQAQNPFAGLNFNAMMNPQAYVCAPFES